MDCVDHKIVENGNTPLKHENELNNSALKSPTSTCNANNPESNRKISENGAIPQLLVDECSPNKWDPQIAEYMSVSNVSVYTTPGASSDKSRSNSYATAKDKLTPVEGIDWSTGTIEENSAKSEGSDSSYVTKSSATQPLDNTFSSNSFTEDSKKASGRMSVSFADSDKCATIPSAENSSNSISINVTSPHGLASPSDDCSLTPSMISSQRDSTEPFGESDEDYFEEYHLPNTHENAFVRHLSFRRKVQTTPINAPDAERIEGLVRTGEFIRHGSIRRKILPEEEVVEEDYEEEDEDYYYNEDDKNPSSFTERIERDIHEIERYLSGENLNEYPSVAKSTPGIIKNLKRTASTPKTSSKSDVNTYKADLSTNVELEQSTEFFEENASIEDSTLRKIQECLDFSTYKDILNLSGRLSDLLSPKEVEEVLNNSERYRQYLNSEVFEALSLSYQGQTHSLPFTINLKSNKGLVGGKIPSTNSSSHKSMPNTDSGFSSPKSTKEKEKIEGISESSSRSELQLMERSVIPCGGIGAQGIFVESLGSTLDLRRISAPEVNLDWSSESKYEDGDTETSEGKAVERNPLRRRISVTKGILDLTAEYQDDIDVAAEAIEKDIGRYREPQDPHTRLSPEMEIPPLNLSSMPPPPDLIPELTAAEEMSEVRHWRNVVIGGAWRRIDMKVIAPFRKCISHGGYMDDDSQSPIVVISAALLPDRSRKDYDYVMDNLFMYVLSFLEQLVADDYVLIYFSGGRLNGAGPGFHWMRRAYEMIDRRLRKNLKSLLVVHPSLWARTILTLARPFISSKFYRKLRFVHHLTDLAMMVPLEQLDIPDAVKQADFQIMIKEKKKLVNS